MRSRSRSLILRSPIALRSFPQKSDRRSRSDCEKIISNLIGDFLIGNHSSFAKNQLFLKLSSIWWKKKRSNFKTSQFFGKIIKFLFRQILSKKILAENGQKIGKIGRNFFAQNLPKWKFYYAKGVWGSNFMKQIFLIYVVKNWAYVVNLLSAIMEDFFFN